MAADPFSPTQFTRESAERIARVVRAAETAPQVASALTFAKRMFSETKGGGVKKAAFNGSWSMGTSATITLLQQPTSTAVAYNLTWPITAGGYQNQECLVGKEGTNWWLVVPTLQNSTAIFITQTSNKQVLSDVQVSGKLDTASCAITMTVSKQHENVTTIFSYSTQSYLAVKGP